MPGGSPFGFCESTKKAHEASPSFPLLKGNCQRRYGNDQANCSHSLFHVRVWRRGVILRRNSSNNSSRRPLTQRRWTRCWRRLRFIPTPWLHRF